MKKNRVLEFTIILIYVYLGSYGMLNSFTETFNISYNKKIIYVSACIFCTAGTLILYVVKKYKVVAAIASVLAANIVLFLSSGTQVFEGVQNVLKIIEKNMREYLKKPKETGDYFVKASQTEGVLFFAIIFITLLMYGIVCCKRSWCVSVLAGIGIAVPFLAGTVPKKISIICLAIVMIGEIGSKNDFVKNETNYRAGLTGIAAGALACVIGITVLYQPLEIVFDKKLSAQKTISSFWEKIMPGIEIGNKENAGTGGVNNGELGQIAILKEDESYHLKVWVAERPKSTLYLQGYIGTEYTSTKWDSIDERYFLDWLSEKDYRREDIRNLQYNMVASKKRDEKPPFMQIEVINANLDYQYRPYISLYNAAQMGSGDTYIKGNRKKHEKYTIWYYPNEELSGIESNEQMEADYEQFVKDVYTYVPETVRNAFAQELEEKVLRSDVDGIIWEVAEMLEEQTEYNLRPGTTPAGKDFAIYFYFENRKGYCSHYATLATLLFRMKEIPARYVSGYVIEPGKFRKSLNGGYSATITGEAAHAWSEVYKQGKGWIPAETTPGYVEERPGDIPPAEEPEQPQEKQPDNSQKEETKKPNIPIPNKEQEKEQQKTGQKQDANTSKKVQIPGMIYVAVGSIGLLLVVCIFVLHRRSVNRRNREMEQKNYNSRIQRLFYKVFEILTVKKIISRESALDEQFVEAVCSRDEKLNREEIRWLLEIVYRANYGKEELQKAEYRFARRLLLILEKIE